MNKNILIIIASILLTIFVIKQCEDDPKIVTKTETKYIKVVDTVKQTIISDPKTVYIDRIIKEKGKDSIVYVDKITRKTIKANQYETKIKSNNATADLKITTTGQLLDVNGVIIYKEKETTTTITKIKPKSGLFIYVDVPINKFRSNFEIGGIYQLRNKLLIKGGIQYNEFTQGIDYKIGVGIKIL